MTKAIKYVAWTIAALILLLVGAFAWLFGGRFITLQTGLASLGPEAPRLVVNGYTFRDLNKNGALDVYEDARAPVDARVDDLLVQMTLKEKAGTLFINMTPMGRNGKLSNYPTLSDPATLAFRPNVEAVAHKRMTHFSLAGAPVDDPIAFTGWQNRMQKMAERTRLGIPLTFGTDSRHAYAPPNSFTIDVGRLSVWPSPMGFAAARDEDMVRRFGDIARQEYKSVGLRLALTPMADLATEPRWSRSIDTYGEDAALATTMVRAYIEGFQGAELGPDSVATMVKHWTGGGPQEDGHESHFAYGKNKVYPGDNFEYHLKPFTEGAFPAGASQLMLAYGVSVGQASEEVGTGYSRELTHGLLRDTYGYDGVICTDWGLISDTKVLGLAMILPARSWGVEDLSKEERMLKLLGAGIDMFGGEHIPELLVKLVRDGKVEEARLDGSVRRVLREKFRLGLFDAPYVDPQNALATVGRTDFVRAGVEAQQKSLVLLKNEGKDGTPTLPLQGRPKLYIENVDPQLAARYAEVVATPEEADFAVIRTATPYEPREGVFESLLHSGDLDFKGEEKDRLLTLMDTVPTIVDIYLDRPAVIPDVSEKSAAVIANFGAEDHVILDLIFGDFSPSGKLPVELPSSMEAVRNQKEDVPYDSVDPLYPFGFGLSYQAPEAPTEEELTQ